VREDKMSRFVCAASGSSRRICRMSGYQKSLLETGRLF
jgi:hypothetical protein